MIVKIRTQQVYRSCLPFKTENFLSQSQWINYEIERNLLLCPYHLLLLNFDPWGQIFGYFNQIISQKLPNFHHLIAILSLKNYCNLVILIVLGIQIDLLFQWVFLFFNFHISYKYFLVISGFNNQNFILSILLIT